MKPLFLFLTFASLVALANGLRAAEGVVAFPEAHGNYGGLLQVPEAPAIARNVISNGHLPAETPLNSGTVTVQLADSGHFSALLNWQGFKYPFKGEIDAGTATFTRDFVDRGIPGQTLALKFTLHADTRIIDCTLASQSSVSTLFTAIGPLSGAPPDSAAGLAFGGSLNPSFIAPPDYGSLAQDIPGDGFAITRVARTKSHAARIVGRLPDTERFSASSVLRGTDYTIFSGLYHQKHRFGGLAIGQLSAADRTSIQNILLWAKRSGVNPDYYGAGFETGFGIRTSAYLSASPGGIGQPIPHISITPGSILATLTFKDGNLGEDTNGEDILLTAQIKIGHFGVKVLGPNPQQIALNTNAAAATWAGSFIHPVSGRRTNFHGGFIETTGNTNGEGRGNFKGSLPANSAGLVESGSARITVN